MLTVFSGLVGVAWRSLERIQPVQSHLAHIGRIQDVALLYHRLAVFRLAVPPLRNRKEDLEELLPVFISEFNAKFGQRVETVPATVWQRLSAYDWPGNARELRNLVERCVHLADVLTTWEKCADVAKAGNIA